MSIDWGIRTSGVVVSSLFLRYFSEQNNVYCAVKTKVYGETMCVVVFCWLANICIRIDLKQELETHSKS